MTTMPAANLSDYNTARQRLRQRLNLRIKLAEAEHRRQALTSHRRTPPSTSGRWTPAAGRLEFKGVDPSVAEIEGVFCAEAGGFRRWGRSPEQARANLSAAMREDET
jgi:hypothetical protein